MPITPMRVVFVLATMLMASACDNDKQTDPDGGSGKGASGGAGSGGGSGAYAGNIGGASGHAAKPEANGGRGGASGSAGKPHAAGGGGMFTVGGRGTDPGAGCPTGLAGPVLVKVPAPPDSEVSSYCVDATEVTNTQYAAFLDAAVAMTDQDEPCAWNTTYTPSTNWPVTDKGTHAVVNVDWCDAFAYCKWAGKHLCGKIGGGESHFSFDYEDATANEWFNACSAGKTSIYPYGDEYDGSACVGIDFDMAGYQPATDLPRAVATPTCVGGYDGLYDLSGNVWEWENSCDGPDLSDGCHMRGGASNSQVASLACDYSYDRERDFVSASLGFRCCSDAKDP